MKSHLLLPHKLNDTKEKKFKRIVKEEAKEEIIKASLRPDSINSLPNNSSDEKGACSPVFDISQDTKNNYVEFSKVIEEFNKDLIEREDGSISSDDDKKNSLIVKQDDTLMLPKRKDISKSRLCLRMNTNSVIEIDDSLLDLTKDPTKSNYSIGNEIRSSRDKDEFSDTTKNINASYDDDISNRREEIEASIESLEFKATMILNNDENLFKQCQEKVKEYFEICMDNEHTSDEEVKTHINNLIRSKQDQSPAVADLSSIEKVNEIVTI